MANDEVFQSAEVKQLVVSETLKYNATNDGATGAINETYHNSSSPAAADAIGGMFNYGNSDTGVKRLYGLFGGAVIDAANGAEEGAMAFGFIAGGVEPTVSTTQFLIQSTGCSISVPLINGGTPQQLSGAGAIDVTSSITMWTTTAADAGTLADGTHGQFKTIAMVGDGGNGTLTPTSLLGYSTITFDNVGDSVLLQFVGSDWVVVSNQGCTLA